MTISDRFLARHNSRGLTLIEVAIVLAVVGLVIGAIFIAFAAVMSSNKVKQANEMVLVLVGNLRTAYSSRATMETSTEADFTTAAIAAEIVPRGWIDSGSTRIINPWGGDLTVRGLTTYFRIRVYTIPNMQDCRKFVQSVFNSARGQGLWHISNTATDLRTAATLPQAILDGACPSATSNSPFFDFLLKAP